MTKRSGLLGMFCALLGLWAGPAQTFAADKVRVGVLNVASINAWVTEAKGFWQEEGLDVTIHRFTSGATVNQALLADGIDFGYIGFGPAIFAAARKLPVVYVANGAYTDQGSATNAIIVRKDSPIKSIKELKGHSVGVHSKGTIEHIVAVVLAEKNGIDIHLREIPWAQQELALTHGDIDAVSTHTPHSEYMVSIRGHRALEWVPGPAIPNFQIITLATKRDYAKKNPEIVTRMVKAYIRTNRWITANPEEAKKIIGSTYLKYDDALVQKMVTLKWPLNGDPLLPSLYYFGDQMKRLGMIDEVPPLESYFTDEYLKKALVTLGRVKDADYEKAVAQKF